MKTKPTKKMIFFVTVLLVSSSIIFIIPSTSSLSQSAIKHSNDLITETIQVQLNASPFELKIENGKTTIEMNDFGILAKPGYPQIPSKIFTIALPPNANVTSVKPTHISSSIIGTVDLKNQASYYQLDSTKPITKFNSNSTLLNRYPESMYEFIQNGTYDHFFYIQIRFTPFTYIFKDKSLLFHQNITLEISYKKPTHDTNIIFSSPEKEHFAQSFMKNINNIQHPILKAIQSTEKTFDYVIITTEELVESTLFLRTWRELQGYSPKLVTLSWIDETYSGQDIQEKIRNFLISNYQEWGINHVLIVGSHSLIPMRYCYPNKDNHAYSGKTPTDYYYADLTGDWDSDEDGYFGERSEDEPDFLADVYVGRIPVDEPSYVEKICQKIIEFEQTDASWKKQALLIGAFLTLKNEDHSNYDRTDAAFLMESLSANVFKPNKFKTTTLYEKEGLSPSSFPCDYPLTMENVIKRFSEGYGIVNWNAHGLSSGTYRLLWEEDDGDGVPESRETASPAFITTGKTILLNDATPAIVFSCSCENAHPEYKNLGVELLKNGAVSFIGASRNAWGTVGWKSVNDGGCTSIDYLFSDYLVNEDQPVAESLYKAKFDYFTDYLWYDWTSYQNLYAFNLYGDPATSFETITSYSPPSTPSIPQGQNIGVILTNISFSTFSTDIDYHELFYQWDLGNNQHSSWMGPFEEGKEVEVPLQWTQPGLYNVSVRVKDSAGMKSDWSNPLQVRITAPNLQIEHFRSGIGSFRVVIRNVGDAEAVNISWNIYLEEGFHIKSESSGVIDSIAAGKRAVIRNPFLFGFGLPVVTVEVDSEKLKMNDESTTALLFGPFIII